MDIYTLRAWQTWLTLFQLLYDPVFVSVVLVITALVAAVVWKHAQNWQRAWMGFITGVYVVWLVALLVG